MILSESWVGVKDAAVFAYLQAKVEHFEKQQVDHRHVVSCQELLVSKIVCKWRQSNHDLLYHNVTIILSHAEHPKVEPVVIDHVLQHDDGSFLLRRAS